MSLTYADISALVDAGNSAAEIATALTSTGVTKQPINRADLLFLLNMRGMLTKLIVNASDEKWTGTILNMQSAIIAAGTDAEESAIRTWLSHITNPTNTIWDTTQAAYASPFKAMVDTFADEPGMPTSDDFAAIVALGGGYKYNVTAEQVQSVIDLKPKEDALAAVQAKANAAIAAAEAEFRSASGTVESIAAAGESGWSA